VNTSTLGLGQVLEGSVSEDQVGLGFWMTCVCQGIGTELQIGLPWGRFQVQDGSIRSNLVSQVEEMLRTFLLDRHDVSSAVMLTCSIVM
jgi:hypothetical protein